MARARAGFGHVVTYITAILLICVCLYVYRNLEKNSSSLGRLGRQIQPSVVEPDDEGNPDNYDNGSDDDDDLDDGTLPAHSGVHPYDVTKLCSSIPDHSRTYQSVNTHFKQWRMFVPRPEEMLKDFKCPCWKSSLVIPDTVSATTRDWSESIFNLPKEKAVAMARTAVASQNATTGKSQSLYCVSNVFLAGFRKCGSTSLYSLIVSHPMVANPNRKEGHFWDIFSRPNSDPYLQLEVLNYLGHFSNAVKVIQSHPTTTLTIDASMSTSFSDSISDPQQHSHCLLPRLHSMAVPGAKYIYILRNPVDRLWSDYWAFSCKCSSNDNVSKIAEDGSKIFHKVAVELVGKMKECFANANTWELEYSCVRKYMFYTSSIESELGDICFAGKKSNNCRRLNLALGLYHYHIERWFSVIPNREQYLFLRTEEMASNATVTVGRICQFLHLPAPSKPLAQRDLNRKNVNPLTHHSGVQFHMLTETRQLLTDFYRKHNILLAKLLDDNNFAWDN